MIAGAAAAVARLSRRAPSWAAHAESWLLGLGTASAWAALGLGLLAEKTAPHVPPAWEVLADHKMLGWRLCVWFTVLAALRFHGVRANGDAGKIRAIQLVLWVLGAGLVIATAWHGAELVYEFGMGVGAP